MSDAERKALDFILAVASAALGETPGPRADVDALAVALHRAGTCSGWQPDDPMDHERDHADDAVAVSRVLDSLGWLVVLKVVGSPIDELTATLPDLDP
jgi:hypothetical protein